MSAADRIALVTVLYNSEKYLPLFFSCLGQQTDSNFVVIVMDNASRDRSLEVARHLADTHNVVCEFIANDANLGIALGNNQGIERARAQGIAHIVLINNDISCEKDLIAQIRARAIEKGRQAWTCLAYLGETQTRWYGGGTLSYWRARGMHYGQVKSVAITSAVAVTYAPTCLMYVHAPVFDQVGLMDGDYFVYYDDTDFCRRMVDHHITLIYDPAVTIRHYVGGSSGGTESPFFLRINTRNKFIYIRKNYAASVRWLIGSVAISSKLLQLLVPRRRAPTWQGLKDAFARRIGP